MSLTAKARKLRKQKLREKLEGMSPRKRKAFLQKLRERKEARKKSAAVVEPDPAEAAAAVDSVEKEMLELLGIVEDGHAIVGTAAEQRERARGIDLFTIWKALRGVAVVLNDTRRCVRDMYAAGVSRKATLGPVAASGVEIAHVDPAKLEEYVKSLTGVWDAWKCNRQETATCAKCPYHRGKGIAQQNFLCAKNAAKEARRINRKLGFATGIPFKAPALRKMSRAELVALLGFLGMSAFAMKDSSKEGIIKYLKPSVQTTKFKKVHPKGYAPAEVEVIDLTQ